MRRACGHHPRVATAAEDDLALETDERRRARGVVGGQAAAGGQTEEHDLLPPLADDGAHAPVAPGLPRGREELATLLDEVDHALTGVGCAHPTFSQPRFWARLPVPRPGRSSRLR